jgi:regulator of sigma E protease
MSNAIYLVILGGLVGVIWYKFGLEGVWTAAKVALGLGFVIFIHELGHFLAAKWCDVHVQTFSIGFGPALPGCSFQRGETTYKIGVLPLGGYVNMVGEGPETDEDENYPRSFKNKTVGQRMLIISAGVLMNVLLGCVLFIVVYYYYGVAEPPAIVGRVDPGSPMWVNGIPSGALITELDGIRNPVFKNLKMKVVLSGEGEKLPFTFVTYNEEGEALGERTVYLLPRKEETDQNPVVGVSPGRQLRLYPKLPIGLPVRRGSAAAAARPLPVEADEIVVAATDPDDPEKLKELKRDPKSDPFGYQDLARRVRALEGKKMVVRVAPAKTGAQPKTVERDVPLEGFHFNDTIVGCTQIQDDPHEKYDPFRVRELPLDPRHPGSDRRDPFAFYDHLRRLAGLPMVVQVRRGDPDSEDLRAEASGGPIVNVFVPPAYHVTFGLRMKMGKVAGLRENSPAAQAGVQKGDELVKVVLKDDRGEKLYSSAELDPERLPDELARAAAKRSGKKMVLLTIRREPSDKDIDLEPVEWDPRWDNDRELPLSPGSPLAIPQLGVAYWVLSQVVAVEPGSPVAEGLKKGDTIKAVSFKEKSPYTKKVDWSEWSELESKRDGGSQFDRWAQAFQLVQLIDDKEVKVRVNRAGDETKKDIEMTATEDTSWPLIDRGILLRDDYTIQKADNFGQALALGARETRNWIGIMYLQLKSLLSGRVSVKQVSGPLGMMQQAFTVAQSSDLGLPLLFLGIISINLAVVNFLPIPILDGGHMVFLIYEKLRGRPPTENVKLVATYIGLAVILLIFVVATFHDFRKMFGI